MSKPRKSNETPPQSYIRLLTESAEDTPQDVSDGRDAVLSGELIAAGYPTGDTLPNEDGSVVGSVVTGITVQGRLFLQQLIEQQAASTIRFKLAKAAPAVIAFALGQAFAVVGPVLSDFLRKILK